MTKIKEWIRTNYILPKILKIKIEQKENAYDPCFTSTGNPYYWEGIKYTKWLWWTFKHKFKDFYVFDNTLRLNKILSEDTVIEIFYYKSAR